MKKYKIIGLSVLMTIIIVSNFVIGSSFDKEVNSNITSLIRINQANAEDYGNDLDGYCSACTMPLPSGGWGDGVKIDCISAYNSLCYAVQCSGGMCN